MQAGGADRFYKAELLDLQHHAMDLNDHGKMAGEYRGAIQHGIYFDGTKWTKRGNGDDFSWSTLYSINNNDLAVGLNALPPQESAPAVVHAVRVGRDGVLVNLGSLTGEHGNARARGINDLNIAVGDSLNAAGQRVAVRFESDGRVTDLSLGAPGSSALDINDRGDIIGDTISAAGNIRGFLIPWDGIPTDIGTLGGTETFVARINARGEIVGRSKTAAGTAHAFLYSGGEMKDLGTLGGEESSAYDINDAGVIVGGTMKTNGAWTPFIKYPGQPMMDLAEVTTLPQLDTLIQCTAINNRGQIIVRGRKDEANYILTPAGLSLQIAEGKVQLRFAGPPDLEVQIDSAVTWPNWQPFSTNRLTTESLELEFPAEGETRFFRATLRGIE
jgi:probable HAF family extracellular repeat protein